MTDAITAELTPFSSVVGKSVQLIGKDGACVAMLAVLNAEDPEEIGKIVAEMINDNAAPQRGCVVGDISGDKWRAWENGMPTWVDEAAEATRYHRRVDAEIVHRDDEDVWCVVPVHR